MNRAQWCVYVLFFFFLSPSTIFAGTFTVTSLNDSGPGSLRQALQDAQDSPETDDIINITVNGIINLTTFSAENINLLPNAGDLTIYGDADEDGQAIVLKRDPSVDGRFFQLFNATLNDMIFDGGTAFCTGGALFASGSNFINRCLLLNSMGGTQNVTCGQGGAIRIFGGTTTMTECTMRGNNASKGAAIIINAAGTLDLFNCTISDNIAVAGAAAPATIYLQGTLNMTNTIIANTLPVGTPDLFDEGNTVNTNVNNLVENFVCDNPATCGSLTFASTADPMLEPTSSDPYFIFMLGPDSPIAGMGIGATMLPGGNLISAIGAEIVPSIGQWGIICLMFLLLIVSVVGYKSSQKVLAIID